MISTLQLHRIAFAVLFACATGVRSAPAPEPAPLQHYRLRVGLPRVAFGNLNENDAIAAYRTFIIAAGQKHGYDLQPDVALYDTREELEQAVRNGSVQLIVMSSWQLLTFDIRDAIEPAYVPLVDGDTMNRVLLIVHRQSGITRLSQLRGQSLLLLVNANATLGRPWLETRCLAEGLDLPGQFFGRVDVVAKPNPAILPVFFRRVQAAIVDEHSFRLACELNPQLGRDLVVIDESPRMLEGIVCLNRVGWESPQPREHLRRSLGELHLEAAGRQILTLFRIDRLVPLPPDGLESVGALAALHARLLHQHDAGGSAVSSSP